jgi:hypothetical protein
LNEEPVWQREARLKGDEARMVRVEQRLDAVHELLMDQRLRRGEDRESLNEHLKLDDQRFASIDSRLQGFQTQLSSASETLGRIEKTLTGDEGVLPRIAFLETGETRRTAVSRFLGSAWFHISLGATTVLAVVALYTVLS